MKNRKYQAFTLVEMLIVMGILSVLMAIGVSVARFAILRANNIQHQNAVDQMYQALQSYYTDNRRYPTAAIFGASFQAALEGGVLDKYVDSNFDGGSPAVFYYLSSSTTAPQAFMVCVSFSDADINTASDNLGGYCNGNGFGDDTIMTSGNTIDQKSFEDGAATTPPATPTWGNFLSWTNSTGATSGDTTIVTGYWNGSDWGTP